MTNQQQNKNSITLFEDLANELFVEILSYLNAIDITITFSNLNYRYQCLIIEFCRLFDLTSINKKQFDSIFQLHYTNQWYSLKLSDGNQTPGQVQYFSEHYSLNENCSQLQLLSITKIKPLMYQSLLFQIPFLTNLVSLEIETICGMNMPKFDLPNLKILRFSSCTNTSWLENFSQIQTIDYTIIDHCSHDQILIWPITLKNLKIIFKTETEYLLIQQSLIHLSQLINLEIYQKDIGNFIPSGQLWEQIILGSLPLLKNLKFLFQFMLRNGLDEIKQTITSFSTSFYIHEKKWFVRCDMSAHKDRYSNYHKFAMFYTIPFSYETFVCVKNYTKIPMTNSLDLYKNINISADVKTLLFNNYTKPDENFNENKIINLIINSSFESQPWACLPNKLKHITIGDYADLSTDNFIILLDNTPNLYSLTAKKSVMKQLTDNWTDICICNHLSRKIRSFTFSSNQYAIQCFNKNELEKILPLFSSKCQYLSLGIHSRNNAIDFILHKMLKLNSLHVYIQQKNSQPITIEWLEQHTRFNRSNCIVVNDEQDNYLWLG